MKSTRTYSVQFVVLALLAGCSAADPGGNNGGVAGAAGTAGVVGTAGAGGATSMVPSQMGNGPQAGRGGTSPVGPSNGGAVGAAGSMFGMGGTLGAGGFVATGGMVGMGGSQTGFAGMFGMGGMHMGFAGMTSMGGTIGAGGMSGSNPEMGRLVGITAAHNAVRAAVMTSPPLPPLVWSDTLAQYAQQWADSLAMTSCNSPHHRTQTELTMKHYGENLAAFMSSFGQSSAQQAVQGWAGEKACWTYGTITGTEKCDTSCYMSMNSDGCGHYTQVVWRNSTQVGCGVATCTNTALGQPLHEDIWICNYAPPGNIQFQAPY